MTFRRLLVGILCLSVNACGPRPVVEEQRLGLSPSGSHFRAQVTVRNDGDGEGQIDIEAEVTETASGLTLGRGAVQVQLRAEERLLVVVDVPVPETHRTADLARLALHATAQYPPR